MFRSIPRTTEPTDDHKKQMAIANLIEATIDVKVEQLYPNDPDANLDLRLNIGIQSIVKAALIGNKVHPEKSVGDIITAVCTSLHDLSFDMMDNQDFAKDLTGLKVHLQDKKMRPS